MTIGRKTIDRLTVDLTADSSGLASGLAQAQSSISKAGTNIRAALAPLAKIGGVIAGVGAAAVTAAVNAGRMADELLDLSEQSGLTTDQLQAYRRVTNQAGVDTDVVAEAARRLTARFAEGEGGSAQLQKGLAALGIAARDAGGNLRPISQIMDEAIPRLAEMEDTTRRNVTAVQLFGESADKLAPVLGLGADEIARLREEANELGLVIDRDSLEQANNFRAAWDGAKQELQAVVTQVGIDLIPALEGLATNIKTNWRPAIEAVADSFVFVVESAIGFTDNLKRVWIGTQGIIINAVQGIVNSVANLTDAIPFLGEKIDVARESFNRWADESMANLRSQMAALGATTAATTDAIRDQATAAAENAAAMTRAAGVAAKAAQFEQVALLDLENTIQGLTIAHKELEEAAVGTSSNIEIQAGGAFQRMADAVQSNANQVLGAVERVLRKLSGGGGFLGGLTSIAGGFLSGGPLGALGAFGGLFADGGRIQSGEFGIVGERGPEIVTGPAQVTPMPQGDAASAAREILASMPPIPGPLPPEVAATHSWYRQLISELAADAKARGVSFV